MVILYPQEVSFSKRVRGVSDFAQVAGRQRAFTVSVP